MYKRVYGVIARHLRPEHSSDCCSFCYFVVRVKLPLSDIEEETQPPPAAEAPRDPLSTVVDEIKNLAKWMEQRLKQLEADVQVWSGGGCGDHRDGD